MTSGWAPVVDRVPARKKPVASAGRKPLTLPVSGLGTQASGVDWQGTEVICRHLRLLARLARAFSDEPRQSWPPEFVCGKPARLPNSWQALPTLEYQRHLVLTQALLAPVNILP